MNDLRTAAQQALEAWDTRAGIDAASRAFDALRAALAGPQSTHSPECYKWHHDCAVAEVERRRSSAARRLQLAQTLQDRLDEAREQRDALLDACKAYDKWADKTLCYDRELRPIRAQIRAAIKAVEEGK